MGLPKDVLQPLIHWIGDLKSEKVNWHLRQFMVLLLKHIYS